jgi:transcriptional regulator with XRE-family HTH domain
MSQEEIGQLLGLGRLAITAYETGRNRISLLTLYRVADILDKSIFDFLP